MSQKFNESKNLSQESVLLSCDIGSYGVVVTFSVVVSYVMAFCILYLHIFLCLHF